ncbi:MAG: hypothetical protein ABR507_00670 [Actinomycetota bacterium]|nr:hypothetical protein [Actinomycetota bacterium]
MIDDEVLQTFASAADTILPGSSALGLHIKVAELFNGAMEGYPVLINGLLDAFASDVEAGKRFIELDDDGRGKVFVTMLEDPSNDVSDVIDAFFLFTLGQNYSEANPEHERVWARLGYHGPSDGVAEYA